MDPNKYRDAVGAIAHQIRQRLESATTMMENVPAPSNWRNVIVFSPDTVAECESIPGWRFYFIPVKGPLAGQPIARTFIAGCGDRVDALRLLYRHYGGASQVLAGRSLHNDESFGEWDV